MPKRPMTHHLRRAYALADAYERAGEVVRARELFVRVATTTRVSPTPAGRPGPALRAVAAYPTLAGVPPRASDRGVTLAVMSDRGLTHVALTVRDISRSVDFYREFGGFEVVHERHDDETGSAVVWLSDLTRPFVVVLIQNDEPIHQLAGSNHLGVEPRRAAPTSTTPPTGPGRTACWRWGPTDSGHPSATGPSSAIPTATSSRSVTARTSAWRWNEAD